MKNADGVLLRFVKKYRVMLKNMEERNLLGRSHIMEAICSANG